MSSGAASHGASRERPRTRVNDERQIQRSGRAADDRTPRRGREIGAAETGLAAEPVVLVEQPLGGEPVAGRGPPAPGVVNRAAVIRRHRLGSQELVDVGPETGLLLGGRTARGRLVDLRPALVTARALVLAGLVVVLPVAGIAAGVVRGRRGPSSCRAPVRAAARVCRRLLVGGSGWRYGDRRGRATAEARPRCEYQRHVDRHQPPQHGAPDAEGRTELSPAI